MTDKNWLDFDGDATCVRISDRTRTGLAVVFTRMYVLVDLLSNVDAFGWV